MQNIKLPVRPTTDAVRRFIEDLTSEPLGWSDKITRILANELTPRIRDKYVTYMTPDQLVGKTVLEASIMIQHLVEWEQIDVPQDILDEVSAAVEEITGITVDYVGPEDSFDSDLDICSMQRVEIAVNVEDRLGVRITDEKILALPTIGHMAAYVTRQKQPVG